MFVSDIRMMEGQPLHYWSKEEFPYFRQFERYYQPYMEYTEELVMPCSPHSTQSDSENSVSSVEVTLSVICKPKEDKADIKCRWRNCGIDFSSLDQLADHVAKIHAASGAGGLFYCGWEGCNRNSKGFNARYKMLVHVRTHTNEKPHQCTQCNKSFSRAENLKIHSRSHSGEKPYVCPVPGCSKAYSNSSDRFKHTRTHSVEKPYKCKIAGCPKRYTDPSSLRKHVKTYKHFVSKNSITINKYKNDAKLVKVLNNETGPLNTTEDRIPSKEPEEISYENVIKHPRNCNYNCCMPKYMKAGDFYRLGALINFENEEKKGWNRLMEHCAAKSIFYKPYEKESEMEVGIDGPLDLSINKKIMST